MLIGSQQIKIFWLCLLLGCGTFAGNPEDDEDDDTKSDGEIAYEELEVPDPVLHPSLGDEPEALADGVNLYLVDAPVDDLSEVMVSFDLIKIKSDSGQWYDLKTDTAKGVDLLQLQGGNSRLFGGFSDLPAGVYDELRIILSEEFPPKATLASGDEVGFHMPSADSSGIKIKGQFTYETGRKDLILDFDLRQSISKVGNGKNFKYKMAPVIKLFDQDRTGWLTATFTTGGTVCIYKSSAEPDKDDACPTAIQTQHSASGAFKVEYLSAGSFVARLFSADGSHLEDYPFEIKSENETILND